MAGHTEMAAMLPGVLLRRDDGALFRADPVGRYVIHRSFLVWCASETLSGVILWGSPDGADIAELLSLWEHSGLRGYDNIVDACRLRRADAGAFQVLADWLQPRIEEFGEAISRQILMAPCEDDVSGAMVAGLPILLGFRHPWHVCFEEAEGLRWLARSEAYEVYAALRPIAEQATAEGTALAAVRDYLRDHPTAPSLESVARRIGRSVRSLQRDLLRGGTSFREELRAARIRAAADRLVFSDDKLEAIAAGVGYSSLSHFGQAFAAVMGVTPLVFRRQSRSASTSILRR
jgi:AraC-like DNA-binding protein